jgi:hypothetical protein
MGNVTWCFVYDPKKSDGVLNGLAYSPSAEETVIPKVEHKEIAPEGKTINAEFYKAVMDRLLKCIQPVRPAAFCCRDFFLLHDNAPAHEVEIFCQFFMRKMLQPFIIPRTLQIYLRQTIFSSTS